MKGRKWTRKMQSIVLMISSLTLSVCNMNIGDTISGDDITDGNDIIDNDSSDDDDGITDKGGGDITKFEGTWKIEIEGKNIQITYQFIGNTFKFSSNDTTETYFPQGPISGTFEFTDTAITFTLDDNSKTWTMEYTLENKNLSLSNSQGDDPTNLGSVTLTKQGGGGNTTKFEGTWKTETMLGYQGTYKFAGNTFEFTSDDTTEAVYPQGPISGTFEFIDTKITFTLSDGSKTWSVGYYNVNALYLTNSQGNNPTRLTSSPLIKQGSSGTAFEGTWKTEFPFGDIGDTIHATYTFTGNTFEFSSNDTAETYFPQGPISGTFEFTDTAITFTLDDNSKTWTMDYYDGDNVLFLSNHQGNNPTRHSYGYIMKQ